MLESHTRRDDDTDHNFIREADGTIVRSVNLDLSRCVRNRMRRE